MREPARTVVYFALFWVGAGLGLVAFVAGNEPLAQVGAGLAVVSLAWALIFDFRRRRDR